MAAADCLSQGPCLGRNASIVRASTPLCRLRRAISYSLLATTCRELSILSISFTLRPKKRTFGISK